MTAFLFFGFFIGIGHAFEADHLAAIGTLASSGNATPKRLALLGASWGIGHTTTLFLFSLAVIVFGAVLSERFAAQVEFGVGIMLVLLGVSVFWKMRSKKIHFHSHSHGDGKKHFHAHSHLGMTVPHGNDPHEHVHAPVLSWRAYMIGLIHGAAGSAGLVALTAAATTPTSIRWPGFCFAMVCTESSAAMANNCSSLKTRLCFLDANLDRTGVHGLAIRIPIGAIGRAIG